MNIKVNEISFLGCYIKLWAKQATKIFDYHIVIAIAAIIVSNVTANICLLLCMHQTPCLHTLCEFPHPFFLSSEIGAIIISVSSVRKFRHTKFK